MIEFLLNDEPVRLEDFPADRTLLDYLRETRRRTGTKEGCASGDCGACTVVLARPADGGLVYESVNSCITFLGAVHGRQVITVEDLAEGDALHPVQRAMVEHHGSQCGFCTPGFVMSMFALYKRGAPADREAVHTALAGNLCRCTGYRPIVDAALDACAEPAPDRFSARAGDTARRLAAMPPSGGGQWPGGGFHVPSDLDEAANLLVGHADARPFCGATDLALETTQQLHELPRLVYLGNVPALNRVEMTADVIVIGAAARYAHVHDVLVREFPDLDEILLRLGSVPIRNQGSIGGNLANASPIGDMPPVLIALDAVVNLRRGGDTRRVQVEDFFIGYRQTVLAPGEFIESIEIPRARADTRFVACKNSKRFDDDISTALGAFVFTFAGGVIERASIAFGGMAATPRRAAHVEAAMAGKRPAEAAAAGRAAIGEDFQPIDDVRAGARYRLAVAGAMIDRACLESMGGDNVYRVSRYAV